MNRREAEEFFDNLEQGLKEDFTIPKKKPKPEDAERKAKNKTSDDPGEIDSSRASPEKPKESGYNRKPPGLLKLEASSPKKRSAESDGRRPDKRARPSSDPLGLEPAVTYKEARGGRSIDVSGLNTFQSMYDRPLPKEFLDLCHVERCSLCELEFTSSIVAKSHYLGKSHQKKTKLYLEAWSARTQNPLPQKKHEVDGLPNYYDEKHCRVCNLDLTSQIVAMAHYQGRKHLNAVKNAGKLNPPPPTAQNQSFGIGQAFQTPKKLEKPEDLEEGEILDAGWKAAPDSVVGQDSETRRSFCLPCKMYFSTEEYPRHVSSDEHKAKAFTQMGDDKMGRKYYCSMCMVQCDTQATYDVHLQSAGHRSKIKDASDNATDDLLSQLRSNPMSVYRCAVCDLQCSGSKDYELHISGRKHRLKAGLPASSSGIEPATNPTTATTAFMCEICKISTTDQSGLDMHFAGKKHKKKAAQVGQNFLSGVITIS